VGAVQIVAESDEIVVRLTSQAATELFRAPGSALASGTFLGTPGDDTVAIGNLTSALAAPIPLLFDGGAGRDTLRLSGSNQELDLTNTTLNQLANLEVLDIVGNSPNKLIVTEAGVVAAAAAGGTLLVRHDDDDTVEYRGRWDVLTPSFADGVFVHVVRQGAAVLHIANTLAWRNPVNPLDGNRDGSVSPIDVLIDVNTLNDLGSRLLPAPTPGNVPEFYHDSSGDRFVSPLDPLQKINFLNNPGGGPKGELADGTHRLPGRDARSWAGGGSAGEPTQPTPASSTTRLPELFANLAVGEPIQPVARGASKWQARRPAQPASSGLASTPPATLPPRGFDVPSSVRNQPDAGPADEWLDLTEWEALLDALAHDLTRGSTENARA